jgi:hypothetical protein
MIDVGIKIPFYKFMFVSEAFKKVNHCLYLREFPFLCIGQRMIDEDKMCLVLSKSEDDQL